jgi:glucose/mannose-6-phosphate isomerase
VSVARATNLDDPDARSGADPGGMLGLVEGLGAQLRRGFELGTAARGSRWTEPPLAVVVCGMGGSGIAGDVARSLVGDRLGVPVVVTKGYRVPAFCGPRAMVVVMSYSGRTEEALATYGDARDRGCGLVAMASGGDLLERARADGAGAVPLPPDVPMPRAALGLLAGSLLGWLAAASGIDLGAEVADAVAALDRCAGRWGAASPSGRNEAKALAAAIGDRTPVVWGSEGIAEAAALRWKCQVNENAKRPAFWGALPEVDHNELEGWSAGTGEGFALVILRHPGEHARTEPRVRASLEALAASGLEAHEVRTDEAGPFPALWSLIAMGDFVSTYLAMLAGVDPMPVPVLSELKARLRP